MLLLSLTFLQSTYGKVRFSEELFHLLLQSEYFGFVDLCELYRSKLRLFDIVTEKKTNRRVISKQNIDEMSGKVIVNMTLITPHRHAGVTFCLRPTEAISY